VLVQPGQKKRLLPQAAARPHDHVRDDLLVRMTEMRVPVDVIDCCRDVKTLAHLAILWMSRALLATASIAFAWLAFATLDFLCPAWLCFQPLIIMLL